MIESWGRLHERVVATAAEHRETPNDQVVLGLTAGEVRALARSVATGNEQGTYITEGQG